MLVPIILNIIAHIFVPMIFKINAQIDIVQIIVKSIADNGVKLFLKRFRNYDCSCDHSDNFPNIIEIMTVSPTFNSSFSAKRFSSSALFSWNSFWAASSLSIHNFSAATLLKY